MPQSPYDPVNTVAPQVSTSGDYMNVRATPASFGGPVGGALEKTGATLDQLGSVGMGMEITHQGIINDALATQADLALAVQGGDIYNQFKSTRGLNAVAAKDQAIKGLISVNDQIRTNLPNEMAQRAYDALARRRLSLMIPDMDGHAGTEAINANIDATKSHMAYAEQSASVLGLTDTQMGYAIGEIKADGLKLQNLLGIPSEVASREAEASIGRAYWNQAEIRNTVNPADAMSWWKNHQKDIPPIAYAQGLTKLTPGNNEYQVHSVTNEAVTNAYQLYLKDQLKVSSGQVTNNMVANSIQWKESRGDPHADNPFQFKWMPLWNKYAKPGDNLHNYQQNVEVGQRAIADLMKKYNGDWERVAVEWCSGSGNVRPLGEEGTPWKNGDYVIVKHIDKTTGQTVIDETASQYVESFVKHLQASSSSLQTYGDWLALNYPEISEMSKGLIHQKMGGNQILEDAAIREFDSKSNRDIMEQKKSDSADMGLVLKAMNGDFTKGIPLTSTEQISGLSPQVSQAWLRVQSSNTLGATLIKSLEQANSRGQQIGYGTDFWNYYEKVSKGEITSPEQLPVGYDKTAPLTNTGFKALLPELERHNDPNQKSFADAEHRFLRDVVRATIVKSAPGFNDTHGEEILRNYLPTVLRRIQTGLGQGKSAADLFSDPKGADYVARDIPIRDLRKVDNDRMNQLFMRPHTQAVTYNTKEDMLAAYGALKTREDKDAFIKRIGPYAVKRGWALSDETAPEIPIVH